MSLKMIVWALGVVSLVAADTVRYHQPEPETRYGAPQTGYPSNAPAPRPYSQQTSNVASISSSDSTADLVERFTAPLVKSAIKQGGSKTDQLISVNKAFIPLARALVLLKGQSDYSYDTQRHLEEVEYSDRVLAITDDFMRGLEELGNAPTDFDQREALEGLKRINEASIQAVSHLGPQDGYSGQQRQANMAQIGSSLDSALAFINEAAAAGAGGQQQHYN